MNEVAKSTRNIKENVRVYCRPLMFDIFVYKITNILQATLEKGSENIGIFQGNRCFFDLGAQEVVTGDFTGKYSDQAGIAGWVIGTCLATLDRVLHMRKSSIAKAH